MAGIRIDVDTSRGISNLTDFRKALNDTGVAARLSDKELGVLADRFRDKLQADRAEAALGPLRKQIEQVGQAAGLSVKEIDAFQRRMGTMGNASSQAGSSITSIASAAQTAGTSLAGLAAGAAVAVTAYMSLKAAAEFVSESIGNAARYETLGVVIQQVGKNAGYTKQEMLDFATGVQSAGISMIASREALSKMAVAQLDLSKSSELARVAQDAAVISGRNSSEAFERIVQGITNGQTVLLRHQGIMVSLEDAYKKYAAQLGKNKDDLDETEKRTAALSAVLESAASRAGVYAAAMETAGKQITSFQRYVDDLKTSLGEAFLGAFTTNVFEASDAMKQLQAAIADPAAQQAISSLANGISGMVSWVIGNVPAAIAIFAKFVSVINAGVNMLREYRTGLPDMFGVFGDAAVKVIDLFGTDGPQKVEKMSAALAASKEKLAGMGDGVEKLRLAETIDKQTSALERFKASTRNAHSLSNMITPTQEERDAISDYWAKYNEGVREYNKATSGSIAIGENANNEKFLPADQQRSDAFKGYEGKIKNISSAWKTAFDTGQWEDVVRLNKSATVAAGEYAAKLDSIDAKANKGKKSSEAAANAAARYTQQAAGYYDNVSASIDQMQDSLTGGTEKNGLRTDKWFQQQFDAISKATIGAKGDVEEYKKAWVLLYESWPGMKMLAVLKDTAAELRKQAQLLKDIGDATGDPVLKKQAGTADVEAWYTERKKQIEGLSMAEQDKAKLSEQLEQAKAIKMLQVNADAYAGVKAVSSEYWNAEKQLIEANLATVKANAEDETAYKIYAAQQWDEFYKSQMEQQAATAGSFAETLAAKWSLAFGGYKDETTKTKESWDKMSDSIITATDGMIDGIAGGFGDMIRNIGNGTASIEDLWKNMLSRMLDMFASFVEDLIKSQLKSLLGGMFSGDSSNGSGFSLSNLLGGSSSSKLPATAVNYVSTGSTGSGGGISDLLTGTLGKGLTSLFSSGTTGAATSLASAGLAGGITEAATGAIAPWATTTAAAAMTEGAIPAMTGAMAPAILGTGLETAGTASLSAGIMGAGAMSGAATMGIGLAVAAGIAGIMALTSGQEEKEPTKTASGYNVAYKGGHSAAYGVDFYSDGSVQSTGASDPDIQKKISDSFKDTAENLSDFAEELGFVIDVLDTFEFPNMNITDDQLDGYIRNGQNQMAFQGLMEAGLRGAFDTVLEDGEIYVDEVERLANAFKSVVGSFEGYGYSMKDVAQISQEQIDNLRIKNTEVAEGTAQALATMAAAMGAASSTVSELASNTSIADAALKVTDEQLQNILEADYASKLLDAVGGEDAFKSIMGNLTENIFDTIDAYAENLGYYTTKAETAIGKLGDATVTVDNFWEMFDAAIKGGLTVDEFEAWGKASEWVNQIDSVTEAMEDWANSMNNLEGSLDARKAEALGMSDQAKYITLLYNAENELYEARKNNYDEAIIAKIQEVQQLEQARALYEIAKKQTQGVQDLNMREMEVTGNPYASIMQAYYDNGWELQEAMESGLYSEADIARLVEIQKKEIDKLWEEIGDAMTEAAQGAHSRMLKAAGKTNEAEMYDFQTKAAQELEDALESGLYSAEAYSELMRSIALEAENLAKAQERQRKIDFTDAFLSGPLELEQQKNSYELTVLQDQISVAEAVKVLLDGTYQSIESAYNTMNSLATSLRSTLQGFRWNDNLSPNTATQTFAEQAAYYQELLDKVAATDKSDMDYSKNIQDLQSFAGTYLESAKGYYGASQEYWRIYESVTGKLEGLRIDTQTDSDIYREQLLAQKEIVNNSQLQIDALTLANTQISEQLSAIALMQAADDLAYKQEAVAQNMTQSQLDTVINSISGTSSQLAEIASSAYTNAANQIAAQQAIYEKQAAKEDIQIGELTLQGQLSQLSINNQEYLNQLINAEKSLIGEGLLNDEMQNALLTIAANYAVYQASLAESSLNSDATSNYYLSEMTRVLTGGFGHWVKAGGYAEAIYNIDAQMLGYTTGIYTILGEMNGKMGTSTGSTSNYLGGFAGGGDVSGPGWFMAGEAGPEPVLLKGNGKASVTSNSDFTGSIDANTEVTAAGLSALLAEMRAMRKELAQIRSTGQRAVAAPARN